MVEGFFFFNESFRALELFLNDIGTPSKIFLAAANDDDKTQSTVKYNWINTIFV